MVGDILLMEDYLFKKLEELKKKEKDLNILVRNGEEKHVGELLGIVEKIVVISVRLEKLRR